MHRFTSQLFMEIETLPADRAMRYYYYIRNSTYKKITYSYGYSPNTIELFKFLHTVTKYLTSLFLYFAWVMFGLSLVLAFLKPADCKDGKRALTDGRTENCTWSDTDYSHFVQWLVKWLANDCPIGLLLAGIAIVIIVATCYSLRQPNAYRPRVDHFGPIAWPILLGSIVLAATHWFCLYHRIHLFGFAFYHHPYLSGALTWSLLIAPVLAAWRLHVRGNRLNPEFGDRRNLRKRRFIPASPHT